MQVNVYLRLVTCYGSLEAWIIASFSGSICNSLEQVINSSYSFACLNKGKSANENGTGFLEMLSHRVMGNKSKYISGNYLL